MIINGVELEYDFFDLKQMKKHDEALAELQRANARIMESESDPYQKMTAQMECIERFFDILFGHGSGTAICGSNNVREHLTAFRELEEEMLEKINRLGIGPGGLGGTVTALAVNIETYPTHIAGLPVAVNICCHVNRHIHRVL